MIFKKPKIRLFGAIVLSSVFLSGCWSSHEINELAISVCLGIDKSGEGYSVSEQIINPEAIVSGTAANQAPVFVYTAEGENIEEAIKSLSAKSSRQIYSAHLQMVVFNEQAAKEGIDHFIDYFSRYYEFRTDFYFVVAKGSSAKDVLSVLTPIESIPGVEMHNKLALSEKEWAPAKAIKITELINYIVADGINPVITAIEIIGRGDSRSTDDLKESSELKLLKYTGLGAFDKDRLVGWLNEDESKGYSYITGGVKYTTGYVSPDAKTEITYNVTRAKSKMKATLKNGRPAINVAIEIDYNIAAIKGGFDIMKGENIKIANEAAEKKVVKICEKSVSKAQKELKTDIFGFGEEVRRSYPEYWKTVKEKWNDEFADMPVDITVTARLKSTGEISKSFFEKEKE